MPKLKECCVLRVAPGTDRLVRRAAETTNRTLTDFVVGTAVIEAERVLADRTHSLLGWAVGQFVELLDRPPQDSSGLKTLFSQPSLFSAE